MWSKIPNLPPNAHLKSSPSPRRFPLPTELDLLIENLKTFAQTMLCTERLISCSSLQTFIQQECIPVGCVPSATVAVCFQGGPHTPLLEQAPPLEQTPPQSRHPLEQAPPWSRPPPGADPPAARHAGIPLAMHAGIAPAMDRMTDMRKNITFATSLLMVIIKHIYTATQVVLSTGKWFRDTMSWQVCRSLCWQPHCSMQNALVD